MTNNNKNVPGYKYSSLGWIPVEWEVKSLGQIGKFLKGKGILKDQVLESGLPCIRYGEIYTTHHFVIKQFKSFISEDVAKDSQEIFQGDILFAGSGETVEEIGKAVAYLDNQQAFAGGDVIIFKPFKDCSETISYSLEIDSSRKQKRIFGQGNSVVHIYSSELKKLKIPLPTLPEQHKIATIVGTWDEAITKTQQLISHLQRRNKGMIQQLLSGKNRLKVFKKAKPLFLPIRSFAKEVSNKNKTDIELIVLSCTKYDGLVPSLEYFGRKIYSDDLTTYKIVSKNSFAYATNHIEEGSIGYQAKYDQALISPMYTVFKTDDSVNDEYLYKVLKSHHYIHEYQKRMEGSIDRRGGLRWDEFSKIKVLIPSLEEQRAIADILNKGDEEVKLQQQRLAALQLQKKGLMQKLLMGELRVNISNS